MDSCKIDFVLIIFYFLSFPICMTNLRVFLFQPIVGKQAVAHSEEIASHLCFSSSGMGIISHVIVFSSCFTNPPPPWMKHNIIL